MEKETNYTLEGFREFCNEKASAAKVTRDQVPICSRCHGTGYVERENEQGYRIVAKCRCRKEREVAAAKIRSGIPQIYHNATLEDRPEDGRKPYLLYGGPSVKRGDRELAVKSQTHALNVCRDLRDLYLRMFLKGEQISPDEIHGLLLYGDCGRGKTRLSASLLCDLIHGGLFNVRFIEYNELFKQIRFSYNSDTISYQGVFEPLIAAKVLVIDDFGMEVSGSHVWVLDNIGYIINERYIRKLPTILTTNEWTPLEDESRAGRKIEAPPNPYETASHLAAKAHRQNEDWERVQKEVKMLRGRISERLRSRIREMCREVRVEGYDFRDKICKNRIIKDEMRRRAKSSGPAR